MFYIYRHIRLDDNTPFYIGKGTLIKGAKSFSKEYTRAYSKQGRNTYWSNIVNSVGYEVEIIFNSDNETEVFNKETEFINLYGRKDLKSGILVNMSNGGEGESGRKFTKEHCERISKSKKGVSIATEHSRKVASETNKGEKNYFYGKKMTGKDNGFYGKNHTEEFKKKYSYGDKNPMFGKVGDLNPFFGKSHSKEFIRKQQLSQSNKIVITKNGIDKIYECLSDCANDLGCTSENLLYRDKQNRLGKVAKFGMFKNIGLIIIK